MASQEICLPSESIFASVLIKVVFMSEKIKVLYVCEGASFAGAEKYAITLIEKLSEFNDVELIAAVFHDGMLGTILRGLNLKVLKIPYSSKIRAISKLRKFVIFNNIQVVHFNDLMSTIIGCTALLFIKNIFIVSTIHGIVEDKTVLLSNFKYAFSVLAYWYYLQFIVDKIICVSNDLKYLYSKLLSRHKLIVIHNGLELPCCNFFDQQQSIEKTNKFVVGTVGRLDTIKGHVYLIEAAREIIKLRRDVLFYIVGNGPLANELERIAIEHGVFDRFRFYGFRTDALSILAGMDIFVLPSLHEGIPFVLWEAMSFCKAVICSNVGGIKEVIENEVDGILLPPKDSFALSKAILILLEHSEYRKFLGINARKKIEMAFSANIMARATYNLYIKNDW